MKAVILAGGKGTRLAPYTTVFPKPMLPIGDMPILEIVIKQLAYYGFKDIVLSVGYLAELIQAYFQNGAKIPQGVNLTYVKEDKPMGTAGSLSLIPDLTETFLVMNGDVLTTLDFQKLIEFHHKQSALLTIAMHKKDIQLDLGIIELDGENIVTGYIEKPKMSYYNSMGIYIYEPETLQHIIKGQNLDVPTLVKKIISLNKKVCGYYHGGSHYWLDMGQPHDYNKANEDFIARKPEFLKE